VSRIDLLDGLKEVIGSFQGEIAGLNRDQEVGCRDECIDGDETERRRRIDHHELVL
jgi:hypothetical protein